MQMLALKSLEPTSKFHPKAKSTLLRFTHQGRTAERSLMHLLIQCMPGLPDCEQIKFRSPLSLLVLYF